MLTPDGVMKIILYIFCNLCTTQIPMQWPTECREKIVL